MKTQEIIVKSAAILGITGVMGGIVGGMIFQSTPVVLIGMGLWGLSLMTILICAIINF